MTEDIKQQAERLGLVLKEYQYGYGFWIEDKSGKNLFTHLAKHEAKSLLDAYSLGFSAGRSAEREYIASEIAKLPERNEMSGMRYYRLAIEDACSTIISLPQENNV
jgi:hypothetical protein